MSKRIRIYTAEDVASHTQASSCWVTRAGKVYDVSGFLHDHPGGDDILLNHAGTDIDEIMKDGNEHQHSDSAYEMLAGYVIGRLGVEESIIDESKLFFRFQGTYLTFGCVDWEATDDFHPDDTDSAKDFEKNQFLDLRKPLLRQVWESNFR